MAHRAANGDGADAGSGARAEARFRHLLDARTPSEEAFAQLQNALAQIGEELQSSNEDHATAIEELRVVNEELQSINEEMQSTNEGLETSQENLKATNITLTRKLEELDRANCDLRNLLESTAIATIFLNQDFTIRSFTPAIGPLYNLIPSDQGRPLSDISTRLEYRQLREDVSFVLSTRTPLERRVVRSDSAQHFLVRILPYRELDGAVNGVVVTFVEVTHIVQAEAALMEADARKNVFLATLSHELRNPLAPLRVASRLLGSTELHGDEFKRIQAIITRQVTHMSSLLDDLLDVARITRNEFALKRQLVEVRGLLDGAIEAVRPAIDAKKHLLQVNSPLVQTWLEVDPVRITQVLSNLLSNAARYTPPGGAIYLEARRDPEYLVISVRDTGGGLAAHQIGKVFDMFTRIDANVARAEGGLGIGLALAKGLVELHGGKIRVNSAGKGQGSEFTVRLPRALIVEPPSAQNHPAASASTVPRRILIADDNQISAETLNMLLDHAGHEVHLAHSGAQALEVANRVKPDVGILDIGMGDIDGYEVARRLRQEAWAGNLTLIAVTGWGRADDKRCAFEAGFDHHLTKPIDPEQLAPLF